MYRERDYAAAAYTYLPDPRVLFLLTLSDRRQPRRSL